MRVLVIGGTGVIGREVAEVLREEGHHVVVGSRRGPGPGASGPTARVDLFDPASLQAAVREVDAVVATMPISDGPRRGRNAERDGTRNLLTALEDRRGVPLVKLSEIGADDPGAFHDLQRKREAEQLIAASSVPALVLRPPWVMEAWPAQLTSPAGVLVPTGPDVVIRWVSARDLGRWTARALEDWGSVAGRTLTAQGPEGLTYREAGRRYARATGRRVVPLPLPLLALGAPLSPRIRTLHELFSFYARSDQGHLSQELYDLLGEPGTDFDGFLRRTTVSAA